MTELTETQRETMKEIEVLPETREIDRVENELNKTKEETETKIQEETNERERTTGKNRREGNAGIWNKSGDGRNKMYRNIRGRGNDNRDDGRNNNGDEGNKRGDRNANSHGNRDTGDRG